MAAPQSTQALVKRSSTNDVSLMPPPPFKRIKRPPKVLDEDEYTAALSEIIARDYFPGLLESQAQHEYLAALESGNEAWIAEAAQKLRNAGAPVTKGRRSTARNTRFDTPARRTRRSNSPSATPRARHSAATGAVADTPVGYYAGSETPVSEPGHGVEDGDGDKEGGIDTSNLSLGAFQAKYTSEDNESFNALLDKQNRRKREKHAYLWTQDQRVPSARLIAYRAHEARLLKEREEEDASHTITASASTSTSTSTSASVSASASASASARGSTSALVENGPDSGAANASQALSAVPAMTIGATDARPARPDAWRIKRPDNSFMFPATSIDEDAPGLPTVQEVKEQMSKAGPKHVVVANTRFPPTLYEDDPGPVPPSPSLNTEIIARRDAAKKIGAAGSATATATESEFDGLTGGETPRVNGYAFVEEDEPENIADREPSAPSYRDLLAGQAGADATPNPFKVGEIRKREELHLRMVERQAKLKRAKERDTLRPASRLGGTTGGGSGSGNLTPSAAAGNMTPAARRLMEKLGGRTPVRAVSGLPDDSTGGATPKDMWTPARARTPRRKK